MPTGNSLDEPLLARERARCAALVAGDREALSALLADDLVHVHTTGQVHDKAKLLKHTTEILRFIEVRRGPLEIRWLAPNAAVMTGPMTNVVQPRGTDEQHEIQAFVTQVWVKHGADWRICSFHAVRLTGDGQGTRK